MKSKWMPLWSIYSLLFYITHAKDKHTDKLAKIGITISFIKYSSFAFRLWLYLFWAEELLYMQGEMQNLKIN